MRADPNAAAGADPETRVLALDGLRGAAAVVVVAYHVFGHAQLGERAASLVLASPLGLLVNGPGAVHVFFVLSGWVLGLSLARDVAPGRLPRFLVRRVFRIHPPYVAAVLLAWVASQAAAAAGAVPAQVSWVRLPADRLAIALVFPSMAFGLLPVGWSLFVELSMSLVFPLFALLARRVHPLAVIGLGAALAFVTDPRILFLRFALDFALGLAVFQSGASITRTFARLPRSAPALVGLAGVALLQLPYAFGLATTGVAGFPSGNAPPVVIALAVGSALLIVAVVHAPGLRRALASPVGRFFGRISYSLYLVHYTVLFAVLLAAPAHTFPPLAAPLVFAEVLALSTGLAVLGQRFVEEPAIRAGRAVVRGGAALARRLA